MNIKLTLNIDEKVIKKAKLYASSNHISVSKLVEKYLKSLSSPDLNQQPEQTDFSPITKKLYGMFKNSHIDKNYDDLIAESIIEKYDD